MNYRFTTTPTSRFVLQKRGVIFAALFVASILVRTSLSAADASPTPVRTSPLAEQEIKNFAAINAAYSAFRNGDVNSGVIILSSSLTTGPGAPASEIQIAQRLQEIAAWLKNNG